jgi:serine/threonine protein phosphatase PrpC
MLSEKLYRWLLRRVSNQGSNYDPDAPVALATDIGQHRDENQDRVAVMRVDNGSTKSTSSFIAAVVADGMGGMIDGAECASLTVATFLSHLVKNRHLTIPEKLLIASNEANKQVNSYSRASGGSTLSAVLLDSSGNRFSLNVGDSRIYATLIKEKKECVNRISVDDSLAEIIGGTGRDLIQFIGMGEGLKPHIAPIPSGSRRIVITSDGGHFFRYETLCDLILSSNDASEVADRIITASRWFGSPDNASLACVNLEDVDNSLGQRREAGITVWDPFGTALILWTELQASKVSEAAIYQNKPATEEHIDVDVDQSSKNIGQERKSSNINQPHPGSSQTIKKSSKKRGTKKAKSPIKGQEFEHSQSGQFSIEIIDRNDTPKNGDN